MAMELEDKKDLYLHINSQSWMTENIFLQQGKLMMQK